MSISSPDNRSPIDSSAPDSSDDGMERAMQLFLSKDFETHHDVCMFDEMDFITDAINDAVIEEIESLEIFLHQ